MSTEYVTLGFALFFGGLVQLLAGMWEFRRNNMFAATALSSYGGFWLSYGQSCCFVQHSAMFSTQMHEGLQLCICTFACMLLLCSRVMRGK